VFDARALEDGQTVPFHAPTALSERMRTGVKAVIMSMLGCRRERMPALTAIGPRLAKFLHAEQSGS
jgi:hypothetical protein